jgi:hypothetical protein
VEKGVGLASTAENAGAQRGPTVNRVDVRFGPSKQAAQDVHAAWNRCSAVAPDRRRLELREIQQLSGVGRTQSCEEST